MIKLIFENYGMPILSGCFVLLFFLESQFSLRKRVASRWKRIQTNFIASIPSFVLLRYLLLPAMVWIAIKNQSWEAGLLPLFNAPVLLKFFIAFFLLDYSNYIWHILLHKLPLLWRFHIVHHSDLDLDLTTAFRFHFGEIIGSLFYRSAAVLLIGASPTTVLIYEIVFEAAAQFHHSNTKLPFCLEKLLNLLIVTPRMHGIHHSSRREETDSNYSVIFSFWDRLHQTIRLNTPQDKIIIGVPFYRDEKELTVRKLLKLPFTSIPSWKENNKIDKGDKNKLQQ